MFLCTFGQNPAIGSRNRMQTSLISVCVVTLNLIKVTNIQWNLTINMMRYINVEWIHCLFQEAMCRQAFRSKFDTQSAGVTLKIRPRSPKSNYFFPLSLQCVCANLVKIHLLVRTTEFRREAIDFYVLGKTMSICTQIRANGAVKVWKLHARYDYR